MYSGMGSSALQDLGTGAPTASPSKPPMMPPKPKPAMPPPAAVSFSVKQDDYGQSKKVKQ